MIRRFRSWRVWLWLIAGWTALGIVQGLLRGALGVRTELSLYNTIAQVVVLALGWALLTPVIGAWHRAGSQRVTRLPSLVAWHLPLLALAAVVVSVLRRRAVVLLGGELGVGFEVTVAYFLDLTIASYLAAIWASRALDNFEALVIHERRAAALRSQLMTSQMEYLDLQLRPHFLFNALGSIAELAHEAPRIAARMLENLIALLESAVSRRGRGLVSLADELRALEPYLEIQRLRFSDWLVIDLAVDPRSRDALIPAFVLQPLVENAVHHGLLRRTERGHITIAADVDDGRLRVAVTDNGAGLDLDCYQRSRGLGLANIKARLATFHGEDGALELRSEPGGGTTARLDIPFAESAPVEPESVAEADVPPTITGSALLRWSVAHPVRALLIGWAAVAIFRIQHSIGYMWLRDRLSPGALSAALRYDLVVAAVWLLLTPLIVAFVRSVPIRRAGLPRRIAVHALAAAVFAFSHTFLTRVLAQGMSEPLWRGLDAELYAWNVAVYVILFLASQFQAFELWIRERETATQHLRAELQEGRLNRVMLELRPGVLFDVLGDLVSLVETNPRLAERRLAELGDFLRATLDAMRHQEVPLAQELSGARAYAQLLAIRTAPGLELRVAEDAGSASTPVPNGILRAAIDAILAGVPQRASGMLHIAIHGIGEGVQIAAWLEPNAHDHTPALTEQISGYLDHGLTEARWTNGQLLLRT